MIEIGNSQEELYIRFRNNIYLQNGNNTVNILNPDGSLNIKVKNIINNSSPFSSQENGFYYYNGNLYLKTNGEVINLTQNNSLPSKSIIMYNGNIPPDGWNLYSTNTEFNGVIYIIKN